MSNTKEVVTVYLTKYALAKGIIETKIATTEMSKIETKMAKGYKNPLIKTVNSGFYSYFWNKEIFLNIADARAKAEEMRAKKIESLQKSLTKLEKMAFDKIKTS